MTAAAKNVSLAVAPFTKFAVQVINGDIVYAGSYAIAGTRDAATSSNRGRAMPAGVISAGYLPLGFVDQQRTGDTSASPIPEASINVEGKIVKNMSITDDAGTIADNFRKVYLTDDQTFTLTRPSEPTMPVGFTTKFVAVDKFDVYFFSLPELALMALCGGDSFTWFLGVIEPSGASGNALTGVVAPCAGRILSVHTICIEAIADADAAYTLNLEIDAVDVTGGVVTIATADLLGAKQSGTAVTANNRMARGSLVDVELVQGTAGTAGDGKYGVYAVVDRDISL